MARVHHRNVKTAPFVDADAEADSLGGDGQHGRVVAHEDDATSRGDGGFDDADNVGNGQAVEQRPHGKILESRWRGGELVAQGIVFHINADQVVQSGGRKAQDAGNLFGVEEVGGLVPVNPHAPEIVAQQIVEGIARQEAQAVRNPVGLVRAVEEVGLGLLSQITDGFGPLLVRARPDAERDPVESVR